jgi:predicted O-methyltransferase YrrM
MKPKEQHIFFYSLIKFKHCKNFLELGTGFGVTAFAVAEAMKENNRGTITSYDKANDSFIKEKIKCL